MTLPPGGCQVTPELGSAHRWALLEQIDAFPSNAPAALETTFLFFCQWCLGTVKRRKVDLIALETSEETGNGVQTLPTDADR